MFHINPRSVIASALLCVTVLGSNGPVASGQSYARAYAEPSDSFCRQVIPTQDGGSVSTGALWDTANRIYHPVVLKSDAFGESQWELSYQLSDEDFLSGVVETSSGDLVVCGSTQFHPWILLLDGQTGTPIWERKVTTIFGGVHSVIELPDGRLMASGTESVIGGNGLLVEVGASGQLLSERRLNFGAGHSSFSRIIALEDGGYAVAGNTSAFDESLVRDVWVLRFDSLDQLVWSRTIGHFGGSEASLGWLDLAPTLDDGFFLTGAHNKDSVLEDNYWVVRLDGDGVTQWERIVDFGVAHSRSLCATPDGGCVAVGTTTDPGEPTDLWMVKFSDQGNLEWQYRTMGSESDSGLFVRQTPGGAFLIAGSTRSHSEDQDRMLLRVDPSVTFEQSCHFLRDTHANEGVVSTPNVPRTPTISTATPTSTAPSCAIVNIASPITVICQGLILAHTTYGEGAPGTGGFVPELVGLDGDCLAGGSLLAVVKGLGGAEGLLMTALAPDEDPYLGGWLLVDTDLTFAVQPFTLNGLPGADGSGFFTWTVLADLSAFAGTSFYLQAVIADIEAEGGSSLTNGLELSIGER